MFASTAIYVFFMSIKKKDIVLEWECDFQPDYNFFFFLPIMNFSSFKCSWWEAKGIWVFKFGTGFFTGAEMWKFHIKTDRALQ